MKKLSIVTAGILGAGALVIASVGIASAATPSNPNVGTSGIPRSIFREERLDAAAEVLNTTTANIQAAHKNKTFATILSNAGLTKQTYAQKLKTELTSDLEAKGYTQDQITIALQHRTIVRLRHHEHKK